MATALIHKVGSDEIIQAIKEALVISGKVKGKNAATCARALKDGRWVIAWIDDAETVTEILDADGMRIGYEESVSDYTPVEAEATFDDLSHADLSKALKKRKEIAGLSFEQVDDFIDALDLTSETDVKAFLKKLARATLGQIKISDHFRKQ